MSLQGRYGTKTEFPIGFPTPEMRTVCGDVQVSGRVLSGYKMFLKKIKKYMLFPVKIDINSKKSERAM